MVLRFSQKDFSRKIKDKSNTVRIYKINIQDDDVLYFNSSKLRSRNSTSVNSFYSHFAANDRERLISWIGDLLSKSDDVKNFIEVGAYVKRFKKIIPSILHVQKINKKRKIIYLESYLLIPDASKNKHASQRMISKERLLKLVRQNSSAGYSFCVNFFNKFTKTDEISNLAYAELKNLMSSFISKDVFISELDNTKFLVSNFACSDRKEAIEFVEEVKTKIYSYLTIESFSNEIDISIGVAESKRFFYDERNMFETIINLAEYAKDDEKLVMFYDENNKSTEENDFKQEVEEVLNNDKLKFFYQPIHNFKYKRNVAYCCSVEITDSIFQSVDDLKNYSIRTDDDRKLFSTILKNCISRFNQQKLGTNVVLFVPISINEIQFMNLSSKYISSIKDTRIAIVLREKDISTIPDEDDRISNFIDTVRAIKSKGFSICLDIEDGILDLSPNIYKLFDFFQIRINEFIDKKNKNKLPAFKGLVENLLKYEKPIIASNIETWDTVELVYKFGLLNFSGEAISPKNEDVVPLDKKITQRIKKLVA